jgi:MarR family transcriptional regulator, organic hydroperoxide resistance regulator
MVNSRATDGAEQLVAAVERIRTVLVTHLAPRWLELNLTMAQVHVLHAVRRLGRASGRQLAAELGVSPAAVVPVCDRLAQQGWIERVRDEHDRRILWLQLTPSGLELVDGFAGSGKARLTSALRKMAEEDRASLVRSLEALATALEAE